MLRNKMLFIIGSALISLIFLLYVTSQIILTSSFTKLEEQSTHVNIQRTLDILSDDLSTLNSTTADWAAWDDTYNFIEDLNDEYIKSNLVDSTFTGLKINYMIYLDSSCRVVFSKGVDINNGNREIPIPATLQEHFSKNAPILNHPDTASSITGIILLPEGPMLIASRPIVTSSYEGPIRGTLVMGRYLDSLGIKRLADKTHLSITIHPFSDLQIPSDFNQAYSVLSEGKPNYIRPLNEDLIAGYAMINDIYGNPALLLRVETARDIYKQGKTSILYFAFSLIFVGLVFCMVVLLLLEKMVLSRLARLSAGVSSIGAKGDLASRVQMAGNDELASLADAINLMLKALEQSQQKLQENEEHFRMLAENARDIIYRYRIVPTQGFEYISPSATGITGYTPEEFYADPDISSKFVHPEDRPLLDRFFQFSASNSEPQIMRWIHKDGTLIWTEHRNVPVYDKEENLIAIEGIARDITERKRAEEQLEHLSLHDPLTGLYNRAYFEQNIRRGDRRNYPVGIVVCDVDGLKLVNDTLGHEKGDSQLIATADVIKSSFREGDMVARIGGDEFAVLLSNSSDETVKNACNRIRSAIEKYNSSNPDLPLSISIGFATRKHPAASLSDLFKEADNNMYREKLHRIQSGRSAIVQTLKKALEARDFITEGHADRLQDLVTELARSISLPENKIADLRLLAQFHDIGKVGIPDRILFKRGPLTFEETSEMQRHCDIGHRIAMSAPDLVPVAEFILKHHEWWNGEGYPLKLKGTDIPLECRILAIADAYDAMTSDRPYRKALTHEEAIAEIQKCAGTQFDPYLVSEFINKCVGLVLKMAR